MELVVLEPHTVGIVDCLAGVDAKQDVVGGGVVAGQVMRIAGGDGGDPHALGDLESAGHASVLNRDPVVLELDEKVLGPKDALVPRAQGFGLFRLAVQDQVGKLGRGAAGEAYETLGVSFEDLLVDPRLVIEPFEERARGEPHQVAHAFACAGEQGEVEGVLLTGAAPTRAPLGSLAGGDVRLEPDDRLDVGRLGLTEELHGPIEVAVVGHGQRRHAVGLHSGQQLRDFARSVQQAVVRVTMQMDECPVRHAQPP